MSAEPSNQQSGDVNDVTRIVSDSGESPSASPGDLAGIKRKPHTMIGEFRLLKPLGRGGMAEVWLAEQTSLKRNVALKLLHSELMADGTYIKRFQAEAKAAAGLNHPNLVQVFTVGFESGQHFISQEYVQGQTLKSLLKKRGPLDLSMALHIMRQVAAALDVAGRQGIVHRDIKPENIMLTSKGQAKVADFGLAQLQGGERLNLTQEGVTMGTPLYMSPEQVSGKKLDQRSDIYSLGVTCYHMLAGRPPFQGENAVQVAMQHLQEEPEALIEVRSDLPQAVCDVIEKMMAKNPDDRYPNAAQLLADLKQLSRAVKSGDVHDLTMGKAATAGPFPFRNFGLVMTVIALFVGLLSAGAGWYLRPRIPAQTPDSIEARIPHLSDARSQFLHAMYLGDDEQAFRGVKHWFSGDRDKIWVHRSEEQLSLLYLRDRRRWNEAESQLRVLEGLRKEGERYYAEARVGQAALAAYRGDLGAAKTILRASESLFEQHLTGSWLQLHQEVKNLTSPESNPIEPPPSN